MNFSSKLKKVLNKKEFLFIFLFSLVALLLRLYKVVDQMPFTFDQGRDLMALLEISSGNPTLVGPTTGIAGVFLGPFYFYFLLPAFLISGGSPAAVMIWVSLFVTLTLPFFFYILKPITGKFWAWTGFIALIFLPGSIMDARVIWNPSLAAPLLILGIWTLLKSEKKPKFLVASALVFALALQIEIAYFVYLLPALLIWAIAKRKKYNFKIISLSLLMVVLTLIPQVIFELRNNFIITNSFINELNNLDHKVALSTIWTNRPFQMINAMSGRFFAGLPKENILFGLIIFLISSLTLVKKNKPIEKLVTSFVFLPLLGLMLHTGNFGNFFDYYLYPAYIPILLALIFALNKISQKKLIRCFLAGLLLISIGLGFIRTSRIIYDSSILQYTHKKQVEALLYPREHHSTDDYAIEVFVPNLQPINYEYLNYYLGQSGQEKVDFFRHEQSEYFIIYEPATGDGPKVAFEEWWKRHTTRADCTPEEKIGIISIEKCFKK